MNRNHTRVLSEQQIKDITEQVAYDHQKYPSESAEVLVNLYLQNDIQGMFEAINDWIETAEDEVRRQLNINLTEDSFNDDQYTPSYGF